LNAENIDISGNLHRARRRILITGGTSGIGFACAERLSKAGDAVCVIGANEKTVSDARAKLPLAGAWVCDVTDEEKVENTVATAVDQLGGLDGVLVSAGIDGQGAAAADLDIEKMRRVFEVNVIGAYLVVRASLRSIVRPGTIILNASINALKPEPGFLDYNASKAALVSMAKSLALELSPEGITVIALCPGYFPTRMTAPYLSDEGVRAQLIERIPAGRIGRLTEIASLVDFLLGPEATYMTGSIVSIDGGSNI
jgi:NAD(P)-dependent dehydrogenase (short-subunit alcohol dehydrogenase family)